MLLADVKVDLLCECHSTPAYSHLLGLGQGISIEGMDCRPECRRTGECSNDAWREDKVAFVKSRKNKFDYAVIDVGEDGGKGEGAVEWLVRNTGAEEVGRFFHRFSRLWTN